MSERKNKLKQFNFAESLPIGSDERADLRARLSPRVVHGGVASIRRRKTPRPFSPMAPVHLVLKASRAKGNWSLLHRKNRARVQSMIYTYAHRFQVKVYRSSNRGNHLHLLVKAKEKKHLADFLRVLAGRIAVVVTGAKKLVKRIGKFWDYLYWSKLIRWGREFHSVRRYVMELMTEESHASYTPEWNLEPSPPS